MRVLGRGGARKSSSCLTAAGLPRLVSRPPRCRCPCSAGSASFSRVSWPSVLRTVMEYGPQLLHVAVLRVEAPRRVRRRSEGAPSTAFTRRSVRSLLCWNLSALSWRTLNSVAGCFSTFSGAPCAVVGPRVVGPGGPLKVVAPLPALARHPCGQVLLQRLAPS